ncbi:MAG TPA: DnaJ domain-containing protein, partial [Stellaceae bacterium]|nr:DnaJ domain-containing protein [Stellaceae bacterium]
MLGVERNASNEEIRRAYSQLAKRYHPDLNPGKAVAAERFKAIAAAYDLLFDAKKRASYDRGEIDAAGRDRAQDVYERDVAGRRAGGKYAADDRKGVFRAEDLSELLAEILGSDRDGRHQAEVRGSDVHYRLHAGFLDAVNGARHRPRAPDGTPLVIAIPPGTEDG